jgi:iduronate 2-sulfatase
MSLQLICSKSTGQSAILFSIICFFLPWATAEETAPPNVLFIAVDDLRCALGCFGDEIAVTPNIDRLASEGRLFSRHYVQSPVCGPSRCSMLTGQRILNSWDAWVAERQLEEEPDSPVSWAHHFRRNGYSTVGIGKISHEPGGTMPPAYEVHQVPFSWDRAYIPTAQWESPWHAFFAYEGGEAYNAVIRWTRDEPPRLPFEAGDMDDEGYADAHIAASAIEELELLSAEDNPFALAVGFFKPHLPHNAPQSYWDLFPAEKVGMVGNFHPPANVDAEICTHLSPELTAHYHWPSGVGNISREEAINQRRAYYACESYVDAQIGKVLDALDAMPCADNTIVVLWSDHGWQLGEHGMFSKHVAYEVAAHSPLIIRTPNMSQPGEAADGIVETVDLFPTLTDLCELPTPDNLPGVSLRSIIKDPTAEGRESAYSGIGGGKGHFGHGIRTDRYRLVRWIHNRTGEVGLVELYDHETDPGENINIAAEHPEVVEELTALLEAKMAERP